MLHIYDKNTKFPSIGCNISTNLTKFKFMRIQQTSANLHQITEKLFLWC